MGTTDDASLLAAIAAELQDAQDEALTVQAILQRTSDVVPEAKESSLTVRGRRGRWTTLASTSTLAAEADQLQYALREGPSVETKLETDWYRSGDVAHDPRWRQWGPRAAELGVRSLLSVRLLARGECVGALNMYSGDVGSFQDVEVLDLAVLYAIHVAYALSSARIVTGLESAMGSRHAVGVAQGVLMERYDLTPEGAFAYLRRVSQAQNVKLRDVAAEVLLRDHRSDEGGSAAAP